MAEQPVFVWSSKKKAVSHVAFGSVQERKMFPVHSAPTRMGIEQGVRGDPHRGPGCYDTDPLNLFLQQMNRQPCSVRGHGFGATLSQRGKIALDTNPSPADYQSIPKTSHEKQAYCPFNSATERFQEHSDNLDHLGPGSHDHIINTNRQVKFAESFGGVKKLKNTVTTKCTMGIPDKCKKCGEVPVGDYYENKNYVLCRTCYTSKSTEESGCLKGMKKVRDCTTTHKHDFPGRPPKTIIMSEKDQKKLQYKEAYLSLYFS